MGELFHQVLAPCRDVRLVRLDRVALGGTKIQANVSKHTPKRYRKIR